MGSAWFVYLVQAENGSLYCGISNDPIKRFYRHCRGTGAKFFSISPALALVYIEACPDKPTALKREHQIKKLNKHQKQQLIQSQQNTCISPIYNHISDLPSLDKLLKLIDDNTPPTL